MPRPLPGRQLNGLARQLLELARMGRWEIVERVVASLGIEERRAVLEELRKLPEVRLALMLHEA